MTRSARSSDRIGYDPEEEASIPTALPSIPVARAALAITLTLTMSLPMSACGRGRNPGTADCTPGEAILVGCSSACEVGSCSGDPVLRVCEGSIDVRGCAEAFGILSESDDSCGTLCPAARLTCPASGRITVVHRAFRGDDYTCDWSIGAAPSAATLVAAEDAGSAP